MIDIKGLLPLYRLDSLGRAFLELTENGMGGSALESAYRISTGKSDSCLANHILEVPGEIFALEYPVTRVREGRTAPEKEEISFGTEHHFLVRLEGSEDDRKEMDRVLQGIVMQMLTGVPRGDLRLLMIDPVSAGADLGMLNRIAAADETLFGGRVYTRDMEISAALDRLQSVLEENVRKISGGGAATAYAYNRKAGKKTPVYLLAVCSFDRLSAHAQAKITALAQNAHRAGLSILCSRTVEDTTVKSCILTQNKDAEPAEIFGDAAEESFRILIADGRITVCRSELSISCGYHCEDLTEDHIKQVLKEKKIDSLAEHNLDLSELHFRKPPAGGLKIPFAVDRSGNLVELELGTSTSAHMLISGTSGSGKSSALHAIILSMCMHYHPDDVEIWAIDYKAVEFAVYVRKRTPHITVIGQDNSHEFSTSLLDMVQEEYSRRKRLFMQAHVENFKEYRGAGHPLSRIVIVIDEFHNLTQAVKDQPQYRDMLETQLRELRAMGMSYVFCSQTISSGLQGLTDAARQQIGVRVCMKQIAGEEVRATIPDMGQDSMEHTRAVLDFGVGQMLYRKPKDSGGYDYLYAKGLFFSDEFRDRLLDRVNETVAGHYTHRRETICKDSERYDIREKPYHALNRYLAGQDMPEGEDGILLYPGAPTDLRDDLSIYLECSAGSNLLLCVGDRELRESTVLFSVMSLLSNPENEVHVHFINEQDRQAASLKNLLSGLQAGNLHLYENAAESFRHIMTLDQLRSSSRRQVEFYYGLEKLKTAAEDLIIEAGEESGKVSGDEEKKNELPLLDAGKPDDEIMSDIDAMLAMLDAGIVPGSTEAHKQEESPSPGAERFEPQKLQSILQQSFEKGPDRGFFSIVICRNAKQLKQSNVGRMENFEYRIGGQMSSDDAYILFGSELFVGSANERTLVFFAGSVKNGRTIRPYLMPDKAFIEEWNKRKDEAV